MTLPFAKAKYHVIIWMLGGLGAVALIAAAVRCWL